MIVLALCFIVSQAADCSHVACPSVYCPPGKTASVIKGTENNCCGGTFECVAACGSGMVMCTAALQAKGADCIVGQCCDSSSTVCCEALSAGCLACKEGVSVEEYCKGNPSTQGCSDVSKTHSTGKTGNPAALNCVAQGGVVVFQKDNNGNSFGVCQFPDGSECEEWALFRNDCARASAKVVPGSPDRSFSAMGVGLGIAAVALFMIIVIVQVSKFRRSKAQIMEVAPLK